MFIYYSIFCILLILTIIDFYNIKRYQAIFILFLIGIALILFSGLRYDTGFDYFNYKNNFILFKKGQGIFNKSFEPGFSLLVIILNKLRANYQWVLIISAILAVTLKLAFIKKYSPYIFLSVLLYYSRVYLFNDLGQIRQGIALGIILWSLVYLLERRFIKFTLVVLLASLFHVSALIFFPVYFLVNHKFNKIYLFIILIISYLLGNIDFKNILSDLLSSLPWFISGKLSYYLSIENRIGLTFSALFRILIVILYMFVEKDIQCDNSFKNTVFNLYYVGVIFYLSLNSLPQLAGRGSNYYQEFEILLIPLIITGFKKAYYFKFAFVLFICFYSLWGLYTTTHYDIHSYIPYKSILNIP